MRRVLGSLGYRDMDDAIEFVMAGLALLPALMFIIGNVLAGAVSLVILILLLAALGRRTPRRQPRARAIPESGVTSRPKGPDENEVAGTTVPAFLLRIARLLQFLEPDPLDPALLRGQRLDPGDCRVGTAFLADMGQDDDVGFALTFGRLALQHRIDRDALVGQDARDIG